MTVLRKDSDEATLLTPWFIGKQDVTTGVAPPRPNGRKSWIYQRKPSKKAARDNPTKQNPGRDIDDLTHREFSGLNRLSSEFLP
jgi:hypothetical protein